VGWFNLQVFPRRKRLWQGARRKHKWSFKVNVENVGNVENNPTQLSKLKQTVRGKVGQQIYQQGRCIQCRKRRKCTVESLQSHWSSGSTLCFASWGTWVQSPGGYLCETGILLLTLSRYTGDPDVTDHCVLVWGRLHPEPSLGPRTDNVMIPLDLTQHFYPGFIARCMSSFWLHNWHSWLLGGSPVESLQSHRIPTQFHWSSVSTLCFLSWGSGVRSPGGYLCETGILLFALSHYST
jgi:hypothetical protein